MFADELDSDVARGSFACEHLARRQAAGGSAAVRDAALRVELRRTPKAHAYGFTCAAVNAEIAVFIEISVVQPGRPAQQCPISATLHSSTAAAALAHR